MKEFRAGVLLGASAGALMASIETLDVIGRVGELLYGPAAGGALAAEIFAAAITMGAILGLALGAAAWLFARLRGGEDPLAWGARLNRQLLVSPARDRRTSFAVGLLTAGSLCTFLYALSRVFLTFPLGPRGLAPFVLAAAGCVALGTLARRALGPRQDRPASVPLSGTFWSGGFLAAGVFVLLYVIDRDEYVRLYTNFHLLLALIAFLSLLVLLATLACETAPERMRFPSGLAILLGLAWLATGIFAVARFNANQDVKAFLFNRTTYAKRIYPILARAVPAFRPRPLPDVSPLPPPPPSSARADAPNLKGANLILITIDAVRADHVGVYGSSRLTTPSLDHFARQAVLFRRAYVQGANTFPSISSLMTGRYPSELQWIHEAEPPLPEENRTLAEILHDAGYDTGAVTPHPYFDRKWGLPQGFAQQDNSAGIYNQDNRGIVSKRIEQKSKMMLTRLRPPFFFWAHFYDPHAHYMPRPVNRFGHRDVDLYDGELAETDAWVGKLLRWIDANVRKPTIVAITADHGDEFGEHEGQFHGTTLYEEVVHVPLLVRVPGAKPAAINTPVQLIDLAPTFLELLRISAPPDLSGRSLGPVFAGKPLPSPTPPVLSEASQLAWKVMVLQDHWKLIYDRDHGTWELYDLRADPRELRNRIGIAPAVAQRLERVLVPWAREHR